MCHNLPEFHYGTDISVRHSLLAVNIHKQKIIKLVYKKLQVYKLTFLQHVIFTLNTRVFMLQIQTNQYFVQAEPDWIAPSVSLKYFFLNVGPFYYKETVKL